MFQIKSVVLWAMIAALGGGCLALAPHADAACVPFEPKDTWEELQPLPGEGPIRTLLCETPEDLEQALEGRSRSTEGPKPLAGTFKDPVKSRDGLAIYKQSVLKTSRGARLVPVLFPGTPSLSAAQKTWFEEDDKAAREMKSVWGARGIKQWRKMRKLLSRYKKDKKRLRKLLLRDGYLFVEDAQTTRAVFRVLSLDDLFDNEEIYLRRGDAVYRLQRKGKNYVFADGYRVGARARLLVFDRVAATREGVDGPGAWDLDRLRRAGGLNAFRVSLLEADLIRGKAIYPEQKSFEAAAWDEDDGTRVLGILVPEHERAAFLEAMPAIRRDFAVRRGIVRAGEHMVDENLRFDEPKTEEGQQDGELRKAWLKAYRRGKKEYSFNGDKYKVFSRDGTPFIPQVCVDFVFDAAERWSGTWWNEKGGENVQTRGFLNFRDWIYNERQVWRLVRFAQNNPDKVDLLTISPKRRVPFERKGGFYKMVKNMAGEVVEGDVVLIYGLRDDGKNHWHSFYVYETDPVFNVPLLLIGNAGTARVQVWFDTMRSAPKRSIRHRIRFRADWLMRLKSGEEVSESEPLP